MAKSLLMSATGATAAHAAKPQRERAAAFLVLLGKRLVILDGAMGTMIQRHQLERGRFPRRAFRRLAARSEGQQRSADADAAPDHRAIHREYLDAGADIIKTNTFNSSALSQADYRMEELARELNLAAARLAREAADESTRTQRPAALRCRRARTHQPYRLAVARRQRSGLSQHQLRRARSRAMPRPPAR